MGTIRVPVPAALTGVALAIVGLLSLAPDSISLGEIPESGSVPEASDSAFLPEAAEPASLPEASDSGRLPEAPVAESSSELARYRLSGSFEGFEAVLLEMEISPGVWLPEHRHPGFVLGYISDGATLSGINYESDQIVPAGSTFFEPEGAIHSTFGSANSDEPTRALLFMVVPADAPLAAEVPQPAEQDRGSTSRRGSENPGFQGDTETPRVRGDTETPGVR